MQVEKKIATHLTKCYSLAQMEYQGQTRYLVASEKQHPCYVLSQEGAVLETVWEGPGGVMTLEPLPGGDGSFLATHRFYSPNDSAEASIILAQPGESGWTVHQLCSLPFVHRFGILERDGKRYVAAATIKSAHAFKEDWTCPGRVWIGPLPEDLSQGLELTPLISGLYHNHGFFKLEENGYTAALIGTDNGIYKIVPPESGGQWSYMKLLDSPASDIAIADFDRDGIPEMLVLSPFHGDRLTIYKLTDGGCAPVYSFDHPLPFLHAIGVCAFAGRQAAVIGHRKGDRDLLMIYHDGTAYRCQVIDHDVGPANVLCRPDGDGMWILSANREIDEVAIYRVFPDK